MSSVWVPDGDGLRQLSVAEYELRNAERNARWAAAKATADRLIEGLTNDERWALYQAMAGPTGRYYGNGGTIHDSGTIDIDLNAAGDVVAVWYRCLNLPFHVSRDRGSMRNAEPINPPTVISGIEYHVPQEGPPPVDVALLGVPIDAAIKHQAACCASRGCHPVCSHLCGTDLEVEGGTA